MGKATRIKQQSRREKIAAQRAAARRAEIRNRVLIAGGSVVAVLAIVLALILVKAFNKPGSKGSGSNIPVTGVALPASVTSSVSSVPPATLDTVGTGSLSGGLPLSKLSGQPPLTSGGKPEMLYIGAEYCPLCAATRWSMAVALSRFGTLSPLHGIYSTSNDIDPHTATLTFYKSSYSSNYLLFTPVENETVNRTLLQNTTAAQQALWQKYDPSGLGYPFIDIGNKYAITGTLFDPAVLKGLSWSQIAAALHNPSSPVAQAVNGAANVITAAICKATSGQPGSVCTSAAVTKASAAL
jgi:Domain of unknown function (DUF929)